MTGPEVDNLFISVGKLPKASVNFSQTFHIFPKIGNFLPIVSESFTATLDISIAYDRICEFASSWPERAAKLRDIGARSRTVNQHHSSVLTSGPRGADKESLRLLEHIKNMIWSVCQGIFLLRRVGACTDNPRNAQNIPPPAAVRQLDRSLL